MTRRSKSNAFALAGVALAVFGLVFNNNGAALTLAIFGGWVCLLGTIGFRMKQTKQEMPDSMDIHDPQSALYRVHYDRLWE